MMILQATLRSVQRRMRAETALRWGSMGLLIGAAGALLLRLASFLWPIQQVWAMCGLCVLAGVALGGMVGLLWPVPSKEAAKRLDASGLRERIQTALELQADQTPMAQLQRKDAANALGHMSLRRAIPLRARTRLLAIGAGMMALVIGLGFVPNAQNDFLKAKASFRQEMKMQADLLEDGAKKLDEADAKEAQETRKLLGDLAKELRAAESPREALTALDQGQRKLENLRQNNASHMRNALSTAGMNDLASALEQGNQQALDEALEQKNAEQLSKQLAQAAQGAGSQSAAQALQQASQAAAVGNMSQLQSSISQASTGQTASGAQCNALMQMAKNATVKAGQAMSNASPGNAAMAMGALGMQSGSGNSGTSGVGNAATQGAGSGAGRGSTNLDAGYRSYSGHAPVQGNAKPIDNFGLYEAIYDPTRLGGDGEVTQERGEIQQGETTEAMLGPGLGSLDQGVPYPDVAYEYQQTAVQAVENANLPVYIQKWVESYFASLLE